jgi:hypothetical protein
MNTISRRDFLRKAAFMGAGMLSLNLLGSDGTLAEDSDKITSSLLVPPFLGKPTRTSIAVNVVAGEIPITCYLVYGKIGGDEETPLRKTSEFHIDALSPKEIKLDSLEPSSEYRYKLFVRKMDSDGFQVVREATFHTQLLESSSFSFALFSDSHITPFNGKRQEILSNIGASILARRPDFALMLGDNIQTFTSHGGPMTEKRFGPILYANLRHGMGELPSAVPVFDAIGNWEGENGWHPRNERAWARDARNAFIPTPDPGTYPEGGGEFGDYYGFTWGDALFLILTVTGYTLSDHAMQSPIGRPDDWTLGEKQKAWLHERLSTSKAKWKLIFIHHTVGGNAGDDVNSRYGRGGGRAAKTGEQALIHQWMKQYKVQVLFYGHDHVFTDIPVDGIHYICVGSAGAPWKFDRKITGYEKYWTPSGFTWVDVKEKYLTVSFITPDDSSAGGKVFHTFEIPFN